MGLDGVTYFNEQRWRYKDWVEMKRAVARLPHVQGDGEPVRLVLSYGKWMWACDCFEHYSIPREGPVACVKCEDEQWHEVDRGKMAEIETLLHPTPRKEMHWEAD